jgi:hypothetical protein
MTISKIDLSLTFDSDRNFLTIAIPKQPELSEGATLLKFCAEHKDDICRAAIACGIETVHTTCGTVEYVPFTPARLLPLRMLNARLQPE